MDTQQKRITLNFHEAFVARLNDFAVRHRMKKNAVLKMAFELLEDSYIKVPPKDLDY